MGIMKLFRKAKRGRKTGSNKPFDLARAVAMQAEGKTCLKIGAVMGMATETVRRRLKEANAYVPHPEKHIKRNVRRTAEIIAMRESGETLEAVGKRFHVTRERIRQILIAAGRDDLGLVPLKKRRWIKMTCRECGGEFETARVLSASRRYCSVKCKGESRTAFKRPMRQKAIKMRIAGASWEDIGEKFGCSTMTAYRKTIDEAKECGIALPQRGRYYKSRNGFDATDPNAAIYREAP